LPSDLLDALRTRADEVERFVDMARFASFRRHPPATEPELEVAERRLGCPIPPPLRTLYRHVANGGFGPGYGLLGVGSGATDDGGLTMERLYEEFSLPDPEDPTWQWRPGLLPFCNWGCVVYSCIRPDGVVVGFDEGRWVDDPISLEGWLRGWLAGDLAQPTAR
jgi:hypothetical protein